MVIQQNFSHLAEANLRGSSSKELILNHIFKIKPMINFNKILILLFFVALISSREKDEAVVSGNSQNSNSLTNFHLKFTLDLDGQPYYQ